MNDLKMAGGNLFRASGLRPVVSGLAARSLGLAPPRTKGDGAFGLFTRRKEKTL